MSLQESSKEIDALLQEECNEWKSKRSIIDSRIKEQQTILASDAAKGDRSENATYQKAVEFLELLNSDRRELESKIVNFTTLFEKFSYEKYKPKDYIDIGSTVNLTVKETGDTFTVKIVPHSVDAPLKGAIAVDCPAGRALMRKQVGDIAYCNTERATWQFIVNDLY